VKFASVWASVSDANARWLSGAARKLIGIVREQCVDTEGVKELRHLVPDVRVPARSERPGRHRKARSVRPLDHARVARAQQNPPPTRTPTASTASQELALNAAIDLHDQGKYDEAIARYQDVLKESPDNVFALFELAFSHAAKKDYQKSLEVAQKGTEYKSDLLAMFYDLMGTTLDSMGEPTRAITAYKRGIELAPDDSSLFYNMAVTYQESLKDADQARQALKSAVAINPAHAEAHRFLGQLFQAGGYRAPAFLAIARFLIIRDAPARGALQAYGLWRAVLRGNLDAPPAGMTKSDEGDFSAFERLFDTSHAAAMKEQEAGKTEIQALVRQLDVLLTQLGTPDQATTRSTFVGTHYVPFFIELKQKNFVEPFAYWVSQRTPVPGVPEWLNANPERVRDFLNWAEKYSWAK
jgi:tetratricopeptide (TPR) repeat protein